MQPEQKTLLNALSGLALLHRDTILTALEELFKTSQQNKEEYAYSRVNNHQRRQEVISEISALFEDTKNYRKLLAQLEIRTPEFEIFNSLSKCFANTANSKRGARQILTSLPEKHPELPKVRLQILKRRSRGTS